MNSFNNNLIINQNFASPGFVKNSLYSNNSSNIKNITPTNYNKDFSTYTFGQKNIINNNMINNNTKISSPIFLEQIKDNKENNNKFNINNLSDFKSNSNKKYFNSNLNSIKSNINTNNINNKNQNMLINDIIHENESDNNEENEDNNKEEEEESEEQINSEDDDLEEKISSEHSKQEPNEISNVNFELENKRMTLEYIKVLGLENKLYSKVNIKEICEENNISTDFILDGNEYYEKLNKIIEMNKNNNEKKIEKFDFDMDFIYLNKINMDKNLELICFISIPRIICMNEKLYLFQITPNMNYIESFFIFKLPEKLEKIIFKFSIKYLKCCFRKDKNTFTLQIIQNKTYNKLTYDIITKLEIECEKYVNGINLLIRNYNNFFI